MKAHFKQGVGFVYPCFQALFLPRVTGYNPGLVPGGQVDLVHISTLLKT